MIPRLTAKGTGWASATCAHCHDTILLRPAETFQPMHRATWVHPDGYVGCWHGNALAVPRQRLEPEVTHTQLSLFEHTA